MLRETCDKCGFDGQTFTDAQAIAQLSDLPARWRNCVLDLSSIDAQARPNPTMWSIAEYTDHVRETSFGMRFVLDLALAEPGTDLGEPPEPLFDPEPRDIDVSVALSSFEQEVRNLVDRVVGLSQAEWTSYVLIGGNSVDAHWIIRHAVHDVSHHLGDIERLRSLL